MRVGSRQAVKLFSILEVGSRNEAIRQAVGKDVAVEVGSEAVGIGVNMEAGRGEAVTRGLSVIVCSR